MTIEVKAGAVDHGHVAQDLFHTAASLMLAQVVPWRPTRMQDALWRNKQLWLKAWLIEFQELISRASGSAASRAVSR